MTEEFQLNDDIYTGTKEVSENLKFESKFLQEWIGDHVKDSGKIEKIEQFKHPFLIRNDQKAVRMGEILVADPGLTAALGPTNRGYRLLEKMG